jgi:hypothetical protein
MKEQRMKGFIQRLGNNVLGVLSGFDRLRLRGTKRLLASVRGMASYLFQRQIFLNDFKAHALEITEQIRQATQQVVANTGRPLRYLPSSSQDKEALARELAAQDGIREGLIGVFSCVEPCWTYEIHRDRAARHIHLQGGIRKCLHYYHYFLDPQWGWCHARLQTWFPFTMHVCLNGRDWLAQQMQRAGIGYRQRDNCFVAIDDFERAQELLDKQLCTDWPSVLAGIVRRVNPVDDAIFAACPVPYYWSADQSEWATDLLFRSPGELASRYPRWLRHGMETLHSRDVLRFLGRKVPVHGYGRLTASVTTDLKERPEGIRIKHWVNNNSIKMYDKQGSVLRVETTINDARDMKVFRPKEGDEDGVKDWRYLRKGIADLHRRAEVSQAANERYLESLAAVEETTPLAELTAKLCRRVRWKGKGVRALNPLAAEDAALLQAINHGEFTINGFRNRDLRRLLYDANDKSPKEERRLSAKVTRQLRLLRAHGLIQKVPKTHRYVLSDEGRRTITAILAARQANTATLTKVA